MTLASPSAFRHLAAYYVLTGQNKQAERAMAAAEGDHTEITLPTGEFPDVGSPSNWDRTRVEQQDSRICPPADAAVLRQLEMRLMNALEWEFAGKGREHFVTAASNLDLMRMFSELILWQDGQRRQRGNSSDLAYGPL